MVHKSFVAASTNSANNNNSNNTNTQHQTKSQPQRHTTNDKQLHRHGRSERKAKNSNTTNIKNKVDDIPSHVGATWQHQAARDVTKIMSYCRRPRKFFKTPACKSEKSAPLSTALACRRDSTSPALASFRTSKY